MRRFLVFGLAMVMAVVVAIPATAAPPDKEGISYIYEYGLMCEDEVRWVTEGWATDGVRLLPGERNYGVRTWHITTTFTNSETGKQRKFQDTGHNHVYYVEDQFHISAMGHSWMGFVKVVAEMNYGRIVLNARTSEWFAVGNRIGDPWDGVCEKLAS